MFCRRCRTALHHFLWHVLAMGVAAATLLVVVPVNLLNFAGTLLICVATMLGVACEYATAAVDACERHARDGAEEA